MARILFLTAVFVGIMTRAFAADLTDETTASASSWTGFYAGINAGGSIGVNSTRQDATFSSPLPFLGTNDLLNTSDTHASPGAVLGGQIGYNWQLLRRWVLGAEADWQWTSQSTTSRACTPPVTGIGFFGAGANGFGYCLSDHDRLTNFGTARARGGFLVGDTLWYATGGLAWGTIEGTFSWKGSATPTIFPGPLAAGPFLDNHGSFTTTKVGWTVGGGAETKLIGGWSAKLEYLYVDLGDVDKTIDIPINPAFGLAFAGAVATASRSSHNVDHIIRVGVNYKFF